MRSQDYGPWPNSNVGITCSPVGKGSSLSNPRPPKSETLGRGREGSAFCVSRQIWHTLILKNWSRPTPALHWYRKFTQDRWENHFPCYQFQIQCQSKHKKWIPKDTTEKFSDVQMDLILISCTETAWSLLLAANKCNIPMKIQNATYFYTHGSLEDHTAPGELSGHQFLSWARKLKGCIIIMTFLR